MPGTSPGMTAAEGPTDTQPMMNIAERKQKNAPADAQLGLRASKPRCGRRTRSRRQSCSCRRSLARRAGFHVDDTDNEGPRGHRRDVARDACAHRAAKLSHSREADATALGQPRRHRSHRSALCIRDRVRTRRRRCPSHAGFSGLRAWTLVTTLEELRGHEEAFRVRPEPDSTRDFGAENWTDRLARRAPMPIAIPR